MYSLEEYYARNLGGYYEALTVGPGHNYYDGRAEADISKWVEYFCMGMAESFENVRHRAQESAGSGAQDYSPALRYLNPRQRKALELFRHNSTITSHDVGGLFSISDRAARNLLSAWLDDGFVVIAAPSKKSRKYGLSSAFQSIIDR